MITIFNEDVAINDVKCGQLYTLSTLKLGSPSKSLTMNSSMFLGKNSPVLILESEFDKTLGEVMWFKILSRHGLCWISYLL